MGGALLPALGLEVRSTVDIDLVGCGKKEMGQTLEIMKIAEDLGLPIDTINQAATYFLNKVGYKKNDLILLYKGRKAKIYRPSLELYWKLKLNRLSETDAKDCYHYFNYCLENNDLFDKRKFLKRLNLLIESESSRDKSIRLLQLKKQLLEK
ncbi:MAG: hypothetical protein A2Z20_03190 [Bdellovibrionales bacterium RBG_16_40_8]|nr:MAG: hypothetical protein A2Z20_03190 [Bdellovibrionales bacterium RBG_16_40_8]